jgi:hypothetical protein
MPAQEILAELHCGGDPPLVRRRQMTMELAGGNAEGPAVLELQQNRMVGLYTVVRQFTHMLLW